MTKSTWMILVVTFAVFCLVRAQQTTTAKTIIAAATKDAPTSVHTPVIVSRGASSSDGGQQPSVKPSSISLVDIHASSPADKTGASSSDPREHISVTTDANKSPGETRKVNTTTPGEKNGVNMLSANVLMLLALVSVCLEMYFR